MLRRANHRFPVDYLGQLHGPDDQGLDLGPLPTDDGNQRPIPHS